MFDVVCDVDLVVILLMVLLKNVWFGWCMFDKLFVMWENDLFDDFVMMGKWYDVDFGEMGKECYLWFVNVLYLIVVGLLVGVMNVYGKQVLMSWGKLGFGVIMIVIVYGQFDKVVIFVYEKGVMMDYEMFVLVCCVMFFFDNDMFMNLLLVGVVLFDVVVDWVVGWC